jgi:hypothetical protein
MNLNHISIAGPFTHDNLSIFLLFGEDAFDGRRFIPLDQALAQKCVVVHETGNVGQLEVENLSDVFDLYIQAGDIVKGGRQDRTLGVDFVLPAKSGRVPIPSFCVESGRWRRRAGEDAASFGSSLCCLSSKKMRMAAKLNKDQVAVWRSVTETQEALSESLAKPLYAEISPTSYQLSVEDEDLQARMGTYRATLAGMVDEIPGVVGYAFVINGAINSADAYGSKVLFRKLWNKLLNAAILEAIAEARQASETLDAPAVTAEAIQNWFAEAEEAAVSGHQEVPPRVRVDTRRGGKTVVFDTIDHGFDDAVLHRNLVAN